ncbi:MAG: cell division protein ZipA C-terminal FtsZ-binding domain-containing protein [Burkholderiales bacterium]
MSDLQVSLLAIGAMLVSGVLAYNWYQERQLRKRLGEAFSEAHQDALLGETSAEPDLAARLEPQLATNVVVDVAFAAPAVKGLPPEPPPAMAGIDETIDCVATLFSETPLTATQVSELLSGVAACGRTWRAAGFNAASGKWEEVNRAVTAQYSRLQLALQMANRGGAISPVQLGAFCDAINAAAARTSAVAQCPDADVVLHAAHALDLFCADVDVAIGVNVVAAEGETFPGARVRALAEGEGFVLEPDGVFHLEDEQGQTLLTMSNQEGAPFLPEAISGMTTRGLTLLLDVPRVATAERALQRMFELGKSLSVTLKGRLVDDNRATLTTASMDQIRQQLKDIHFAMNERGISPGSVRALRLFS